MDRVVTWPPEVSVLITSHRSGEFPRAWASVCDEGRQTFQEPIEVLAHYTEDGGGTCQSVAKKVNGLASIAQGEGVMLLADDDEFASQMVEYIVAEVRTGRYDVIYTNIQYFGAVQKVKEMKMDPTIAGNYRDESPLPVTAWIRRSLFLDAGGYDPEQYYQDKALYYECCKRRARFKHIEEPLFRYQAHIDQGSNRMDHSEARARFFMKYPELMR